MRKILVVDDDKDTRDTYRDILKGQGYGVWLANNGEEAIKMLKMEQFDLVLSDTLRMLYKREKLFLEELRDSQRKGVIRRDIWVIASTARGRDPDILRKLLNVWVNGFIEKPAEIERIKDVAKSFSPPGWENPHIIRVLKLKYSAELLH